MSIFYCEACGSSVNQLQNKIETIEVRGEEVSVESRVRVCECGNELFDELLEEVNLSNAYNKYREKYNILSPEAITNIRNKYSLSQRAFSKVLGWGEITVHRYESGAVPNLSHNKILRLIENPESMKKLLVEAETSIPKTTYNRTMEIANNLLSHKESECFMRFFIDKMQHPAITIESGFKQFDIEKFTNAVLYFAHTTSMLWKTKLNKLLFYTDFLYFNKYTVSLTGAKYIKLDYGPVPDKYEALLWFLETRNVVKISHCQLGDYSGSLIIPIQEFNPDVFSEEELKVLAEIFMMYGHLTASQISQKSHEELPWIKTPPCGVISYESNSEGGESNG